MNAPAKRGNQGAVRVIQALLAALVVASLGCASALPQHPPQRGNVVVQASNHVSGAYELKSVMISVDGEQEETTQGKALQHLDPDLVPLATLRLARGEHKLLVRTLAEDRTSDRVISLAVSQPFRLDANQASITVHVFTPRSDSGTDRRIEVSFDIQGGAMREQVGAVAKHPTGPARCHDLPAVRAAICRTELQVEEATASRDVILTMCMRDKLQKMRTFALTEELSPQPSDSAPATRYDAEVGRMTADRVHGLEKQLSRCATTSMRAGLLVGSW
jgi:hypothetical protein